MKRPTNRLWPARKRRFAFFETEAKNAGIEYGCRAASATPADALKTIGATARLYDLAILSQPDFSRDSFDNKVSEETLFATGGPVLFMPNTFKGTFEPRRVGICWDGSRLAARAVRDAMPLLRKSDALTVVTLTGTEAIPAEASPAKLARFLARVGLPARLIELEIDASQIQSGILSVAADESLQLLVMGGYGHSRLKEFVLGGVTRDMLHAMTVPTLMSH
jgi:nucleotide-binding universal stress UspA family protein